MQACWARCRACLPRLDDNRSLFLFTSSNRIRLTCVRITQSDEFQRLVLGLILANCVTLAFEAGLGQTNRREFGFQGKNSTLNTLDLVFALVFSLEMAMKLIADGGWWCGKLSYFYQPFNWLDAFVVIVSWLDLFAEFSFSFLRALRVLRPLKAISSIEGMRIMVTSMVSLSFTLLITLLRVVRRSFRSDILQLASTWALGDVLSVLMFILFIFALVAMQFFAGKFTNRCFDIATGQLAGGLSSLNEGPLCKQDSDLFSFWPGNRCGPGQFCADSGLNPDSGVTSFDNILLSWVVALIAQSGEGWSGVMYFVSPLGRFSCLDISRFSPGLVCRRKTLCRRCRRPTFCC